MALSVLRRLLSAPHPMSSQPWNQSLLLYVICVIRRYRMNLGGGVPTGAPREPRIDRQNLQLPDLWSSLLAANRHWMGHDGSRIEREFGQNPVYIRAYIGWWRPDFSLVQFCNRNVSCGVTQGLLRKMYIYFWEHKGLGCCVTWVSRGEKLVALLKNEVL